MHKKHISIIMIVCLCLLFIIPANVSAQYNQFIFQPPRPQQSFFQKYIGKYFQETVFDGSYAIVIAVGDYTHLRRLVSVQADAEKMKMYLLTTADYDEVVVLTDGEATFETIRYFMEEYFPSKMNKDRYRFLFYFSGHGSQRKGYGDTIIGFLQLKGATTEPTTESINMHHINNWAMQLPAATHMLFLLDACFSGLAGTQDKRYETAVDPVKLAQENGRYMITAGGADQTSIASLGTWGGSLFTDVVISGMKGAADPNADGVVTMYELFSYTQAVVRNEANKTRHEQTPLISNLGHYTDTGQYFFVYTDPNPPVVEMIAVPDDEEKKQVSPALRSAPQMVSPNHAEQEFGLTTRQMAWGTTNWAPRVYIENQYENRGEMVFDHATGLTWQKSGSSNYMSYADAQDYVKQLNRDRFAGYNDWRLPTIPELMSLLEPERSSNGFYIDPIFDSNQSWCWSADKRLMEGGSSSSAWLVAFGSGRVNWDFFSTQIGVRCVRS